MADLAVWGDFEVDRSARLGRGGFGIVYRGRQVSLDRPVAIKVLDTSRAPTGEFEQAFLEKFESEARVLARLHDPRIITVFQAGRNDGTYWYAMELVEGVTVEDRLTREGMFEERAAARIAVDVAHALDAALQAGIVHRDVKPGNIFILPDGSAKLGDFGIARSLDAAPGRLTEARALIATPEYCSPEQGLGDRSDHRSDIYSLGVVLFEMLTERPPFGGESTMDLLYKHASQPPPSIRLLNPKVSESMERVVLSCLEKEPAKRPQTYAELARSLELAVQGRSPGGARRRTSISTGSWVAAGAGAAAFLLILLTLYRTPLPSATASDVVGAGPERRVSMGRLDPLQVAGVPAVAEGLLPRLRQYVSSADEEALLAELRDVCAAEWNWIRKRRLDSVVREVGRLATDGRHTPYTRWHLQSVAELVRLAEQCVAARHREVAERSEAVTLALEGGETVEGRTVDVSSHGVIVERTAGGRVEVTFERLALADYVRRDPQGKSAVAMRLLLGEPGEVVDDLLRAAEASPELAFWIPVAVALARVRAHELTRADDLQKARAAWDLLLRREREIVGLFPYLRTPCKQARMEQEGLALMADGAWVEVLARTPAAEVAPMAAARLLRAFEARLTCELMAADGFLDWELRPEEPSLRDRLRHWDLDRESGGIVLRDEKETRSLVLRQLPAGGAPERGMLISFRLRPSGPGAHVRISLGSSKGGGLLRLEESRVVVSRSSFEGGEKDLTLAEAAVASAQDPEGWRRLALVVLKGRFLVYLDGTLVVHLPSDEMSATSQFAISVHRGELFVSSVKVEAK